MKIIEAIPDLVNFYILLPNGNLGSYTESGGFKLHPEFTELFREHIAGLLETYQSNPDEYDYRIGIVYPTHEEHPWKSATLALETEMVHRLYPSGGARNKELTSFQRRNIEKSIYQGFELLMEFADQTLPDCQIYCPVLFFRQQTLDGYTDILHREATGQDKNTPVLDVLNFLAPIPKGRRSTKGIHDLTKAIYEGVINKGARKSSYDFMKEKGKVAPGGGQAAREEFAQKAESAFADIFGERRKEGFSGWMQSHCSEETYKRVGRWLVEPYKYVKPDRLTSFSRFRDVSPDGRVLLSDKHPIFEAPFGTQILARGTADKWNMYLLDGTVQLEAEDGEKIMVEALTPRAAAPIASLKPRVYTVTAATPIKFLWMFDPLVDTLISIDRENKQGELSVESLRD